MSVILAALERAQAQRSPVGPDALALLAAEVSALTRAQSALRRCRTRHQMVAAIDALTQDRRDEFSAMASAHNCAFHDRECVAPVTTPTPPAPEQPASAG